MATVLACAAATSRTLLSPSSIRTNSSPPRCGVAFANAAGDAALDFLQEKVALMAPKTVVQSFEIVEIHKEE